MIPMIYKGKTFGAVLLLITCIINGSAICQIEGKPHLVQEQKKSKAPINQSPEIKGKSAKAELIHEERSAEALALISYARSAPPEFTTDIFIRLAESDKIADLKWKRELLEEAFQLAQAVQQPVRRVSLPSTPTDTREGSLAASFDLKLDALSLQCRIINAMIQVDKKRARELIDEVKTEVQPFTCADNLLYDLSDFYITLTKVAESAYSDKEVKNHAPLHLIERYIYKMTSSLEIAPAVEMLMSIKLSPLQRQSLLQVFSKQLGNILSDDRSFTYSLYRSDQSIKKLIAQCVQLGFATDELLSAYRTYLIRHFSAVRCADSNMVFSGKSQAAIIKDFNNDLRFKSEKNIVEISADEMKPEKVEGISKFRMYWQSVKASKLLSKVKKLRFGFGEKPLTVSERDTLDWQTELDDFVTDLSEWRSEDEQTEEDYFQQKCRLFKSIIQLDPNKISREVLIRKFLFFLDSYDMKQISRIEWFWQAKFFLKDTTVFDGNDNLAPSYIISRKEIMPILEITKNPTLRLYIQTEKFLSKVQL